MMLVLSAAMASVGGFVPIPMAVGLFILGWVLQFVGHYVY